MHVLAGLKRCLGHLPVWSYIGRNKFFIWQHEIKKSPWVIQPKTPHSSLCQILLLPECVTVYAPYCKVKSRFDVTSRTVGSPNVAVVNGRVPALSVLSLFQVWYRMVEVKLVACWWLQLIILWVWIPAAGFTSTASPFLVVSLERKFWLNWGGWKPHCDYLHATFS